jgi:antitoxin component of RelBE/YafQ-DinJ toxin-antitoxin module
MSSTLLSIKTDEQTKRDVQSFAKELGVSSTAFVNMIIRQALRDRRLVLTTSLEPTPYLEKLIRTAETDYVAGKNITTVETAEELDDLFKKL